jgi:predicted RNA polymerase sigma factor
VLLFMCCHPSLSPAAQIALTLRAVGGLTTAEIARAFLTSEATMTRRITRAKEAIKDSGLPFRLPAPGEREDRLRAVLHVLYLTFNEGYASTSGSSLVRVDLTAEAIRLARLLRRLLPDEVEVAGLLALILLTDARRPARTGPAGELVTMADQDRGRWNAALIQEGVALVTDALGPGSPGPYQLQAAIAALHDEAPSFDATDWPQIVALYELLMQAADNPIVARTMPRRWRWHRVQRPACAFWSSWPATSGSPAITGCTPLARTCRKWRLIQMAPGSPISPPRTAHPTWYKSGISASRRRSSSLPRRTSGSRAN